jgi:hypothetical protein
MATLPQPDQLLENVYGSTRDKEANKKGTRPPYMIMYSNWYRTIPYGFKIVTKEQSAPDFATVYSPEFADRDNDIHSFFFPVNPESISISTPFAVQVTPTLGGIVEEHSGAVFYNITVSGTTGIIPEIDYEYGNPRDIKELRSSASPDGLIPSGVLGGFGAGTINAINSAVSKFTGVDSKVVDGERNRKSGYTAFHVLYKFIWLYHHGKANGSTRELVFVNYKDNNQYKVVVQNFQLSRDKSRPHLYQYTIQMKGWKLETASKDVKPLIKDATTRLKELGLQETPSVKAMMFRVINTTKSTLNAAAGLLNTAAQDLAF